METVLLAKQAIYDTQLNIYGYELLFRPPKTDSNDASTAAGINHMPTSISGDHATTQVILGSFNDIGIDQIVGPAKAFINFTHALLVQAVANLLPKDKIVVEILETVIMDAQLFAAVTQLSKLGYQIALDDFIYRPDFEPFIDLANIIKIDVLGQSETDICKQLKALKNYKGMVLAEKIENNRQFQLCQQLGFHYFQGYYLSRPELIKINLS